LELKWGVGGFEFAGLDAVGYDNNMISYGPLKLGCFVKALVLISPNGHSKAFH